MRNILERLLNPQAIRVYKNIENTPLTAKEIGKRLKIFPNAVYREIEKLKSLGLVVESSRRPIKFGAQNLEISSGVIFDLLKQGLYGTQDIQTQSLKINFIQTRKQLLEMTNKDTRRVRANLNLIVSGHEVPAETILAQKHAIGRGVNVRMIIQDLNASSPQRIMAWQKMGIVIRHLKHLQARIFVFDGKTVYFTSYSENKNDEAIGMRFEYAPFARLMDEMFEQRWGLAKDII